MKTTHPTVEEAVLTAFILRKNIHVNAGENKTEEAVVLTKSQLTELLTTLREDAVKEERESVREWIHENKDLTVMFGENQADWYVKADELLQALTPPEAITNNKN